MQTQNQKQKHNLDKKFDINCLVDLLQSESKSVTNSENLIYYTNSDSNIDSDNYESENSSKTSVSEIIKKYNLTVFSNDPHDKHDKHNSHDKHDKHDKHNSHDKHDKHNSHDKVTTHHSRNIHHIDKSCYKEDHHNEDHHKEDNHRKYTNNNGGVHNTTLYFS